MPLTAGHQLVVHQTHHKKRSKPVLTLARGGSGEDAAQHDQKCSADHSCLTTNTITKHTDNDLTKDSTDEKGVRDTRLDTVGVFFFVDLFLTSVSPISPCGGRSWGLTKVGLKIVARAFWYPSEISAAPEAQIVK